MIKHNGAIMNTHQGGYNTTGSDRSTFMNWLQEKVQNEMEKIESDQAASKKTYEEIKPKRKRRTPSNPLYRTEEQRKSFVHQVDQLREEGLQLLPALNEVGISSTAYYNWKYE